MSRYTRSVYGEAINDNGIDIDTDAYASLLDNDYCEEPLTPYIEDIRGQWTLCH